jgi:hypothetical protein
MDKSPRTPREIRSNSQVRRMAKKKSSGELTIGSVVKGIAAVINITILFFKLIFTYIQEYESDEGNIDP